MTVLCTSQHQRETKFTLVKARLGLGLITPFQQAAKPAVLPDFPLVGGQLTYRTA
jgi:hypothetical protein